MSIASLIMGFLAWWSFNFFKANLRENIALLLAIGVGALVYAILIYFMRIPEVDHTIKLVKERVLAKKKKQEE